MVSQLRSWWQKTSKMLDAVIIISLVILLILLVLIILGYLFNWSWTGLHGKTLYDWLQLLIIPAVLSFGVWWLTRLQQQRDQQLAEKRAQTELEIATDNQREAALKEYLEKMSELLLHENLRQSDPNAEVRKIARVWTLTVLPRLDIYRKRSLLQFLYESDLINVGKSIID